eukprot:c19304_g1_i1 orf=123-2222(-)
MQLHNVLDSATQAPLASTDTISGPQGLVDPIKKPSTSKGSRISFESTLAGIKPMQIAVKIDHPSSQADILPKSFEIEAKNLCYKTPTPDGLLHKLTDRLCRRDCANPTNSTPSLIVKNVSFKAKSGEILAIAGPSGAGKSTLLELLAGKICPSSPPHSILINQQPMDMATFRRISGYIPQSDALFPLLSVKETFLFSAHLRLPPSVSSAEKQERVDALMKELGLMHVAETRIGNEDVRGVSGGERRRVSIGVDVIHDPAVLLLDEPTSGLDSASALHVVEMLRTMAKTRSRTIILSIHQPGYRIIQQINSFLLLANGYVVHHGSLQHLHQQLMAAGHKIPPQVNILEYAIEDIAARQSRGSILAQDASLKGGQQTFHEDQAHEGVGGYIPIQINSERIVHTLIDQSPSKAEIVAPAFANNSFREITVLSQRFSRNVFRTYELFTARTLQAVFAGLALGLLYIHVGTNLHGVVERMGFFAFTLTFLLSSTVEALPIFLQERHIFMRETSRGAYRISSYLMANFLVFLPFLFMLAVFYSVPVYWLIGLSRQLSAFCFFVFVVWLVLLMANAFVAFFGALVPDYIIGNSMISGCMGAFFLFSGYFISKQDMPSYWRFMHYVSLFKYPLDALLINEYASAPGKCFGMLLPGGGCTVTSEDVLLELGLEKSSKWNSVLVMVMFICVYRLLCHAVLQFKVCKRSR